MLHLLRDVTPVTGVTGLNNNNKAILFIGGCNTMLHVTEGMFRIRF
jgi:hypothetical protein